MIRFQQDVEPGIIQIFDMFAYDLNQDDSQDLFKLALMRDNTFLINEVKFQENENSYLTNFRESIIHLQAAKKEKLLFSELEFSAFSALSFNWPYLAASGLGNFVIIINLYDRRFIKRIEIAEEDEQAVIL